MYEEYDDEELPTVFEDFERDNYPDHYELSEGE